MNKKRMIQVHLLIIIGLLIGCVGKTGSQKEAAPQESYYALSDFKFVPKIDVHAHINVESRTMIEQAKAYNFKLMVMAVDVVPEYPPMEEQIRVRVKHHKESPDVFAFTSAFTLEGWDDPDWSDKVIEQLKRDFKNGALGIKVWKNIGMGEKDKDGNLIMLDDPKFDRVFQFVKDQNKVVMSHAGEPKNCWLPMEEMTVNNDREYFSENPEYHMYLHPEMPSYEDQINARNNMLEKNKDITFIAVHLATLEWSVDEIAAFLDRFPNASVDVAERLSHLQVQSIKDRQKVRNFIIKYQDRILYGTDFQELEDTNPSELKEVMLNTWMQDWKYLNTDEVMTAHQVNAEFQGLKLPKSVVDKIYLTNAQKIFPNAWEN